MVKDYKPISIDRRMPDEYYGPCFEFYCVFSG